jgi:hypothetical protein
MYDIPFHTGYKLTSDFNIIGKKGRPLSFTDSGSGHLFCNVYVNQKSTILYLHRAVALVHVDGFFEGAVVDHIDNNPRNNHPTNLRWITTSENGFNRKPDDDERSIDKRIAFLKRKITEYAQDLEKLETIKATLNI